MSESVIATEVAKWLYELADPSANDPLLAEMQALARERGFPIVGPEVGRLLGQVTRMLGAKRIFEMGSGFGYSTLWFARAAGEGATIYHTDGDPDNTARARDFLCRAGVAERVTFLCGDAMALLRQTEGDFDIVFCDVDKHQYPEAYEAFEDRVRVGGAVIIDNLVWSGRVARGDESASTAGVREYIARMWNNPSYLSSLMPVRDGVGLSLRLR
jgi:predicted O-methyltransferase YrrM